MRPLHYLPFLLTSALLGGLLAGIVLQKYFPVGRLLQRVAGGPAPDAAPGLDRAFAPVSPPPSEELRRLAAQLMIQPLEQSSGNPPDDLASQIPAEEAFARECQELVGQLRAARDQGSVAEIEYRFDRIFREADLESFEKAVTTQELETTANRLADFSKLLRDRGTHLIYCPAPNPLDCYLPRMLDKDAVVSALPNHTRLLLALGERGVDVIDLRPTLGEMTLRGGDPYHRFDHHWTPAGIERAAEAVAAALGARFRMSRPLAPPNGPGVSHRWTPFPASSWNLSLAPPGTSPGSLFAREVLLGGEPLVSAPESPLWVMGDSMLLEASLVRSGISADFGSHLAARLEAPVNTLGRPGTVDIRQAYFLNSTLSGRQPRILLWIHADEHVEFPEINAEAITAAAEAFSGTASVVETSSLPDPATSPYPDAIFSLRVELALPRDQKTTAILYTWGFRDRQPLPAAKLEAGAALSVTLRPWMEAVKTEPQLGAARIVDNLENPLGEPVFWWPGEA